MKRLVFLFVVLMAALPLSAQYIPAEGLLTKNGRKLFSEGRKLTKDEISATLSMFSDDKGVGYDFRWTRAHRGYNAGIALTTLGSVGIAAGGVTFSYGFVTLIVLGISAPFYVFEADTSELDADIARAGRIMVSSVAVLSASAIMLGAGIPLLCVNNSKMKKIVRGYNEKYGASSAPSLTLDFGPTRSGGIGFALNF